jgi:hypothetical protein
MIIRNFIEMKDIKVIKVKVRSNQNIKIMHSHK